MRNFQPISRRISETVQDETKVTILMTYRNSHMRFWLVRKSSTLD